MEPRSSHNRSPHQLPAGRHGLPRAFVVSNQRERILDAVLQAASQSGYAAMRIEDVIAIAGVSRRTFYDHFANKEEAFLAAYELVLEQLLSGVTSAFATGESWTSRVRRGLAAFLNLLASEPVLAQVCVVEALAAGPRALARRTEAMEAFQALLQPPKGDALATSTAPPVAVEAIVGGIYEVIYSRVTTNRTEELPSLLPSLLHSALLPFVGADVAEAEYERTMRTAAERAIPAS
ncbi:MAG TPA: TetR/AcrR family transcriptional regulator [Baekduia sp.]|nr:TetR/AcrR family transcriptional regulator [Baekduia sp.]